MSPHWRVLYPKIYFNDNTKPLRSLILINTKIPTNNYKQIQFDSADVTGLILTMDAGKVVLINVYNDCNNNNAIDMVSQFLSERYLDDYVPNDTHIVICSDFNRHHPWWESEEDGHLTSAEHLIRPLIDLTTCIDLCMALPLYLPTLQAFFTGNWTRPDNVWCSSHTTDYIIRCTTNLGTCGPNTDHMPIHTILDMNMPHSSPKPTWNFRATDWTEFNNYLTSMLVNAQDPKRIQTPEEFREALSVVNKALKATIEVKVPKHSTLPHTKRWWNQDLTKVQQEKNKLTNLAYKWRGLPDHHTHEDHKWTSKTYVELIEKLKKRHWETWLLAAADHDL